jgi:hypothetical protein
MCSELGEDVAVFRGLVFVGMIKGSPPPVTIGENVVDCGRVGF